MAWTAQTEDRPTGGRSTIGGRRTFHPGRLSGDEITRRWRLLSPSHLRTVRAVVEHGSIQDAAASLGRTTSSVYQHLSALERGLDAVLLASRTPRAVPTDAGHRLAEHAHGLLVRLERVEQEMADYGAALRGTLRVVSDPTTADRLLVPLMVRLAEDRPRLEVRADVAPESDDVAALAERVRDARSDLAVGGRHAFEARPDVAGLDVQDLGDVDLRVVLHPDHPAADGGSVDPSALRGERWVTGPAGTPGDRCLLDLGSAAGFRPDVAYRSASWSLTLGLVRGGLATAVTTRALPGDDRSIAVRRLHGRPVGHHLLAVTRRHRSAATDVGLRALRAVAP